MFEVVLDDRKVSRWVLERTPYPQNKGFHALPEFPLRGIGYRVDGKLVAGFIFFNHCTWNKSIETGVAVETHSPILRGILRHAMVYPFNQLACQRVTAMVPKRADKSRKLVKSIGFQEEGNIRHGFVTDDCMVYGLLKKEAETRWKFGALQEPSIEYDRLNERPYHV